MNFIKVGAACPITNVADVDFNVAEIKKCIDKAVDEDVKILVFPELSITSYTCADLFYQQRLMKKTEAGLKSLCTYSENKDILLVVGAPFEDNDILYNCAFVIFKGSILGIVPKSYLPNNSEFYEKRWFSSGINIHSKQASISFQDKIPFGTNIMFRSGSACIGIEICEDLWATIPPSSFLSLAGCNILCNLSASNELVSKADYRRDLVRNQSARCLASYIYSSAGVFESSTDIVCGGHLLISENGSVLAENERFNRESEVLTSIIDINKLKAERIKSISFRDNKDLLPSSIDVVNFKFDSISVRTFDRYVDRHPFVPSNPLERDRRSKEIFNIQTAALAKRMTHTNLKKAVIGISGGLDSTLALLVVVKTFDMLKMDRKDIVTITMPGFGTTDRTYNNALELCKHLGTDLREINIVKSALQHFEDIGHPVDQHDVTYENVQARERTEILMNLANKEGGLVIGTGDLSELALGWCTYNGDHMSMYSVNCSIPKTLVRYLVDYVADHESTDEVKEILLDILDTPVSPELLPKDKDGNIAQKTEDIVGPYELHDFFLYHFMKHGASKDRIEFLARIAFKDIYSNEEISKWLNKFITRFFTQQFKRSALPDGPKVGSISLSPRGDLRMPSDASYNGFK